MSLDRPNVMKVVVVDILLQKNPFFVAFKIKMASTGIIIWGKVPPEKVTLKKIIYAYVSLHVQAFIGCR